MFKNKNSILAKSTIIIAFCVLWQIAFQSGRYSALVLPSLPEIALSAVSAIKGGELKTQLLFSLVIILKGIAIGTAISGALLLFSRLGDFSREVVSTLVSILHPLPGIAILPLVVLWLGVGESSVLLIIVHSVVWPMLTSLTGGVDSISPVYLQTGENYGFNPLEKLVQIYIPAAMPSILSGFRISWARSWRALISSEMVFGAIGSSGGIGWFIFQKRVFMDTAGMYAGLIFIIAIGMVVEDFVFSHAERLTIEKWGMKK